MTMKDYTITQFLKGDIPTAAEKSGNEPVGTRGTDIFKDDTRSSEHISRSKEGIPQHFWPIEPLVDMILERPGGGRPTFLSLVGSSEGQILGFSSVWTMGFALLNAAFDRRNPANLRSATLIYHRGTERWVQILTQHGRDKSSIQQSWTKLDPTLRSRLWPHVMLWLMYHDPGCALQALLATCTEPYPPRYAMLNAIDYIVSYHLGSIEKYKGSVPTELLTTLYTLLDLLSGNTTYVPQKTIYELVVHCTPEQVMQLYDALTAKNVDIHWNTLLHFAYSFGRKGDYERALYFLYASVGAGANVNSERFLGTCIEMMRESAKQADGYHASSQMVSSLLQMGVRLTLPLYNVLMLNAVEAGDLQVALRIFDLFEQHNIEPDGFTYCILLKGCKDDVDPDLFNLIIKSAARVAKQTSDPWIATQILHCVYLQHKRTTQRRKLNIESLKRIVRTFSEFFDTEILVELQLLRGDLGRRSKSKRTPSVTSKSRRMLPSVPALSIVISALLEHHSHGSPMYELGFDIEAVYWKFHSLVEKGVVTTLQLVETDHIYNAFLKALGRRAETLGLCPVVLTHMAEDLPPVVRNTVSPFTKEFYKRAPPSVQTFSILLHSFLKHKQVAAAEKVLDLMKKRNLEPNNVTWGTLIYGYSRIQDVERAVDSMREMEFAGIAMDQYTLEALSNIKDREKLMDALKRTEPKTDGVTELAEVEPPEHKTETNSWEGRRERKHEGDEEFSPLPSDLYVAAG